jgi:MbtH protein
MRTFVVVVNQSDQYSIWPDDRELPVGWTTAGVVGEEADCLSYIDSTWTGLRVGRDRE